MVNIYDQAHALANAIKQSEEYTLYARAKEAATENETNQALLKEYKKLQFQLQVQMAGGAAPNADDLEKIQKLTAVLQMSPEATAYLMAEMRLQRMLADVYKILGEAAGVDLDMLQG
jgi:cell fate (sporulation/competence/biofilm development) regulator YlbF (YheA/YmcA/DUF963 family)